MKFLRQIIYGADIEGVFPNVRSAGRFHDLQVKRQRLTDYKASVAAEDLPVLTEPAILRNAFAEHFRRCVAESPANAQFTVNTGGSSSCISVSASMNPMPQPVRSQCLAIADVGVEKDGVGSSAIV